MSRYSVITAGHCLPTAGEEVVGAGAKTAIVRCRAREDADPTSPYDIAVCETRSALVHFLSIARGAEARVRPGESLVVLGYAGREVPRVFTAQVLQNAEVLVAEVSSGEACPGDSGAVALVPRGRAMLAVGVLSSRSRSESDCQSEGTVRFAKLSGVLSLL